MIVLGSAEEHLLQIVVEFAMDLPLRIVLVYVVVLALRIAEEIATILQPEVNPP
jgi:hypothetical protein